MEIKVEMDHELEAGSSFGSSRHGKVTGMHVGPLNK